MKCSNCGSDEFVETPFPIDFVFTEGKVTSVNLKTYICLNCGHYEFFCKEVADELKNAYINIKDLCEEQSKITKEILNVNNEFDKKISGLNDNKIELVKKAMNLDLTIREKNKLDEEIDVLNKEIKLANKCLNQKLEQLKDKLTIIQDKIKNEKSVSISHLYK